MIIYIILTEQIITTEIFIEKFNDISLRFNTTAKGCSEIFPNSLLGQKKKKKSSATKSLLRFLKALSSCHYVFWGRYMLFQDRGSSVILLVNVKALTV